MAEPRDPKWPEGLSDEEAVMALQSTLIAACKGNRDISRDRDYKALRRLAIKRADLNDVVPKFGQANRDLASMWAYLRTVSGQWQPRREHVWNAFKPMFDRVEGRDPAPVTSAKWTGRRTTAQQAQVVLSLAPNALLAVDMLIEEQMRSLHNGGPIEPEREDALKKLRDLRDSLDDLLETAEAGDAIQTKLESVKRAKTAAFKWVTSPYGLALGDMPLVASSTVLGCAAMYLVNLLTKGMPEAAAMGAAVTALHGAAALQGRKANPRSTQ